MKRYVLKICSWMIVVMMICMVAESAFAASGITSGATSGAASGLSSGAASGAAQDPETAAASSAEDGHSREDFGENAEEAGKADTSEAGAFAVTSVAISRAELSLCVGETEKLSAYIFPENASDKTIVWSSSDAGVAQVSQDGIVVAGAPGKALVSVTTKDGALTASCAVLVSEPASQQDVGRDDPADNGASGPDNGDTAGARTAQEDGDENAKGEKDRENTSQKMAPGEEKSTRAAMKSAASEDADALYGSSLPDGEYAIADSAFDWNGGTGKARLTCRKVIVKDGMARGVFSASSASMTHIYYGGHTSSDEDDPAYYNPATGRCGEKVVEIKEKEVTFPVILNQSVEISGRTTAMSAPHWVHYWYRITLAEPEVYNITLRAADAETGDAIERVSFSITEEATGKEIRPTGGSYPLSSGSYYTITASADNYETEVRDHYQPSKDEALQLGMNRMEDKGDSIYDLRVRAEDTEGNAISGIRCEVIRETDAETISIREQDGRFPLVEGKVYTLRISAEGYQTKEMVVQLTEDSTRTVVLERELYKVHVRVIDTETQYNLSKATVTVKTADNQPVDGSSAGTYEIPYGTVLTVTASNTGYQTKGGAATAAKTFTVTGDETVTLELIKKTYSIKVSAVDAGTGKAIPGAVVTVKDGATDSVVRSSGGAYPMQHGSIYTIGVTAAGYAAASMTHKASAGTTVTIRLTSTKKEAAGGTAADSKKQADKTEQVADNGTYNVKYKDADNSMFNVVGVVLHVRDGAYTADISLSGEGYDYVYPGTSADALKAGSGSWSKYWKNSKGKYTYTIDVPYLDKAFILASRSSRYYKLGKGNKGWLDGTEADAVGNHEVIIYSKTTDGKSLPTHPGTRKEPANVGSGASATASGASGKAGKKNSKTTKSSSSGKGEGSGSPAGSGSTGSGGTNGSTGSVNNQTGLSDGTYKPDSFSFSGGTGKLSISCDQIIIKDGKTYARITFSSTYIQYVKAGGQKITDYTRGAGSTSFVIPVELNKNNNILALTTKMSSPHEVGYTIYIGLEAAKNAGSGSGGTGSETGVNGTDGAPGVTEGDVSDQYDHLDEKAPGIMGLTFEKEIPVEHSDLIRLYQYADGYRLIELDVRKRTIFDEELTGIRKEEKSEASAAEPDGGAEEEAGSTDMEQTASEQKAALYDHAVYKYLLVPEGSEIPAGIDRQLFVIRFPADKTAAASAEALEMLDALDLMDQVAGIGIPSEEITVESVRQALQEEDGETSAFSKIGTYDDLDYRTLLLEKMNLLILPSGILPQPGGQKDFPEADKEAYEAMSGAQRDALAALAGEQLEQLRRIGSRGVQLQMGVIVDRSQDETSELARAEWIKLYGLIYGKEKEADAIYQRAGGTAEDELEHTTDQADAATGAEVGDTVSYIESDPTLRMLNLRMKLENIPQEEMRWEERNGFLFYVS